MYRDVTQWARIRWARTNRSRLSEADYEGNGNLPSDGSEDDQIPDSSRIRQSKPDAPASVARSHRQAIVGSGSGRPFRPMGAALRRDAPTHHLD
jgi:hypothetical protein